RPEAYDRYLTTGQTVDAPSNGVRSSSVNVLINAKNVHVVEHLRNLYNHLLENHYIDCIVGFDPTILHIFSRDALRRIKEGDPTWESMVPESVATAIKKRGLFGYNPPAVAAAVK
ncbi:MAG: TonB-dependent receptor, partial [Pseudomonadota bacterium]